MILALICLGIPTAILALLLLECRRTRQRLDNAGNGLTSTPPDDGNAR